MYSDERYVIRAVKAGARGYLLKNSAGDELVRAIQQVQRGNAFFSPAVAKIFQEGHGRLADVRDADDRYELLTERERQIYQLLAEGNSNKDIANRLNLSLHTVETHRWRVMDKLDLHSTAELVLSAVRPRGACSSNVGAVIRGESLMLCTTCRVSTPVPNPAIVCKGIVIQAGSDASGRHSEISRPREKPTRYRTAFTCSACAFSNSTADIREN